MQRSGIDAVLIKDNFFVEGKEVSAGSNPRMSSATDTGSVSRDYGRQKDVKASDKNINFLYLNVCGLKHKLYMPEFNNLIQIYDIVSCVETK